MYAIYIERHTNVMWNLRVSPCFQPSLVCLTLRAPGNYTHRRGMREFHAQNASKKFQEKQLVLYPYASGTLAVSLVFLVLQELTHEV